MKLLISLALLAVTAQGFVAPSSCATKTALNVAAPPMDQDWSTIPIPARVSTVSTPVKKVSKLERQFIPDRIVDPDYTLAIGTFLLGPLIAWYHPCKCVQDACLVYSFGR